MELNDSLAKKLNALNTYVYLLDDMYEGVCSVLLTADMYLKIYVKGKELATIDASDLMLCKFENLVYIVNSVLEDNGYEGIYE